jgi:hypothetical protein
MGGRSTHLKSQCAQVGLFDNFPKPGESFSKYCKEVKVDRPFDVFSRAFYQNLRIHFYF